MTQRGGGVVTMSSPAGEKVALFRRLFGGREDVFARRFESRRTGKSGYQPMCGNEWVRGVCGKPKVRCAACPQRAFVPVSDRVVFRHLRGKDDEGRPFTMGVYPMLADETVRFAAIDFDKRLDTLPQTAGRFRVHARLPIPFGANPCMEVDLLDADTRLAVELDDAFTLSDTAGYRRARRKDLLLQTAGWRILRFLVPDVSVRLASVLDDIFRALDRS